MTWRSFMEYVIMLDMGQEDAIQRNYDVYNLNGSKPGIVLDRAFARMGFDQRHTARPFVLPIIAQRMRDVGYRPPDMDVLARRVRCWYNWDRIRAGDLQRWPMRFDQQPFALGSMYAKDCHTV